MDQRVLQVAHAMDRLDVLIDRRPELAALAAESLARMRFLEWLAEFERLAQREADAAAGIVYFGEQLDAILARLDLELCNIDTSAKLAKDDNARAFAITAMPKFDPDKPVQFWASVTGYLDFAATVKEELIDAGMHPCTIENARKSRDEFSHIHFQLSMAEHEKKLVPQLLQLWREPALVRIRQLYSALAPAMNPIARAEWKASAALGRTHRPKQLPAPKTPLLLGDGTPSSEGLATVPINEEKTGIAQRTKRAILRVIAGRDADSAATDQSNAAVSEIRRLPAPADPVGATGTDGK